MLMCCSRFMSILFFVLVLPHILFAQIKTEPLGTYKHKLPDSLYIIKYDTLLHLQSSIFANNMEYHLKYNKDFELRLSPNNINSLSFGFSYRYLDLGLSFTPQFLGKGDALKGESDKFTLAFGFSMHRFRLSFDLTSVKGFYLKNSADFGMGRSLPDSPFLLFPNLQVAYFSTLLQYNMNPKFSTSALVGASEVQAVTAWTITPTMQFATYRFNSNADSVAVETEQTYSTDLNLILPVLVTWVFSPKVSASIGGGPSIGVDFFKSVALNAESKVVLTKGTKVSTGLSFQTAFSYHKERFYTGIESRYRIYGHKFEDLERLSKQYSYFQVYFGYRLNAPRFMKKSLDWGNKVSPVKFE
jgi:hypothetical protein